MCLTKSIITETFTIHRNPSRDIETLDPSFQIVRESSARFVLVLDVSGSMRSYVNLVIPYFFLSFFISITVNWLILQDRIGRLNRSARRWITYDLPNSSQLAIVTFE